MRGGVVVDEVVDAGLGGEGGYGGDGGVVDVDEGGYAAAVADYGELLVDCHVGGGTAGAIPGFGAVEEAVAEGGALDGGGAEEAGLELGVGAGGCGDAGGGVDVEGRGFVGQGAGGGFEEEAAGLLEVAADAGGDGGAVEIAAAFEAEALVSGGVLGHVTLLFGKGGELVDDGFGCGLAQGCFEGLGIEGVDDGGGGSLAFEEAGACFAGCHSDDGVMLF